ncbi:uncharacterized protein SPPG_02768 [Spizellomyces punctatus DAOM BR117]|uniref:Uncharacterized protein n=1 Tax=Spizellomyces punctatus (strain DAOM BR117) TaxID=645134 RepID=A0A0L0HMJ6_SPIPD|nr:uncharacterized protein SPPG_02768 [Spizellomyces punctatus DAOM BR117]KND02293.1 hypothetical protein SPPG_02768 [Spizellomyces punctatus DAOM BR117]|eukprot:XP_016610332.1 hypothetical protein SPPG_02768 [Spizellomyces punctatus DAOM BR117]
MHDSRKHEEKCICAVCTCGRHKLCKVARTVEGHLDAHTEYGDNYVKYQTERRLRGKAHPQQLSIGGDFYGSTENREKFVAHAFPPQMPPKKVVYARNDAPFDSTTTQKHDFPAWPITTVSSMRPKANHIENTAKFDGQTTNRRDFRPFELQSRPFRKAADYLKPNTRFEGVTTHDADYRAWPVPPPAKSREVASYVSPTEDREFKSTTGATYVGHQLPRSSLSMAPRQAYVVSPVKFEGVTTNRDSFRRWTLPTKEPKKKAIYTPNQSVFQDSTTYHDNYQPKTVERLLRIVPKYQAVPTKFDATSTHRLDYQPPAHQTREADFRPRATYNPQHDDRDWGTTMRSQYTPKPIPRCPAVPWMPLERERHDDGHVYLTDRSRPALAGVVV